MKIYDWNTLTVVEQKAALKRPQSQFKQDEVVNEILNAVKNKGDSAVKAFTEKFDRIRLTELKQEENSTIDNISEGAKKAIEFAYQRISLYNQANMPQEVSISTLPGVICERIPKSIENIGLYIPGGTAPLVSTLLMLAIPALLAGCPRRILCTPPNANGEIDPHLLFAAKLCQISEIYKIGGAQAIAAMAYGTETIKKVDKIFGPGNSWVTEAKVKVSCDPDGAAIDMPAGPSEVLVIADDAANPEFVAADLLSQAEHGTDSQVILITFSKRFAEAVINAVEKQTKQLSRFAIIEKSLAHSRIFIADTLEQAIEINNEYAPEHLILQIENPQKCISHIKNAGAVFVGPFTPETFGDYVTGSNHVLPTAGYARTFSGLSIADFMKYVNVQTVTKEGYDALKTSAEKLAEIEGLTAHLQAVTIRKNLTEQTIKKHDIETLIRKNLRNTFTAYSSARDEAKNGRIWMNANELPWDLETEKDYKLNRYPDKQPEMLLKLVSELYEVKRENVAMLRGSDEAIDLLMRLVCEENRDAIITCPPTYSMYAVAARLQGAKVIEIPLLKEKGFQLDMVSISESLSPTVKIIFICSPNNPTGNIINTQDILSICEKTIGTSLVVVDEAYLEFSSAKSLCAHIQKYPNLIVLRTFSKAMGLAGARFGTLIAEPNLVAWIQKIMPPYPLPFGTIESAIKILSSPFQQKISDYREKIQSERASLIEVLSALPFVINVWPSETNYILFESTNPADIQQICKDEGIVLRYFPHKKELSSFVRITIGTPDENAKLISLLHKLRGQYEST